MAVIGLVACIAATPAFANETITYSYGALGRLIASSHSGTANNGQSTSISYDPADNRTNYTVAGAGSGVPTISISDASVTEGGNLVFTVMRSGSTTGAVSASWATANGTATAGSEYMGGSGTISFGVGETSKTITVTTIDDAVPESTESMTVALGSPTGGATLGTGTGTGTITDNDAAAMLGSGLITTK